VTGPAGTSVVEKIRGRNVVGTAPTNGQALIWNNTATQWEPQTVAITMAGDVTGPTGTSAVARIQGRAVATSAPTNGQVLTWNATPAPGQWEPATPAAGGTLAGDVTGALGASVVERIRGRVVAAAAPGADNVLMWNNTAVQWEPHAVPLAAMGGDVTGTTAASVVARVQGRNVATTAPTAGQVLTWSTTPAPGQWQPAAASGGTLAGDVTGASGTSVVERIRGRNVADTAPTAGQVLTWSTTPAPGQWQPGAAAVTLAGDVTGAAGTNTVVRLQGRNVATTAPNPNQVLLWNGPAWTPTSSGAFGAPEGANLMFFEDNPVIAEQVWNTASIHQAPTGGASPPTPPIAQWSITAGTGPTATWAKASGGTASGGNLVLAYNLGNIVSGTVLRVTYTISTMNMNFALRRTANSNTGQTTISNRTGASQVAEATAPTGTGTLFLCVIPGTNTNQGTATTTGNVTIHEVVTRQALLANTRTMGIGGLHIFSRTLSVAAVDETTSFVIGGNAINMRGISNCAIGPLALRNATTCINNTGLGSGVFRGITTGGANVVVGANAGGAGNYSSSVIVGAQAAVLGASSSVVIGVSAHPAGSPSSTVAIGDYALRNLTTGWNNVAIGSYAANSSNNGSLVDVRYSTYIGSNADANSNGVDPNPTMVVNENVWGYNARGGGENTFTIGSNQTIRIRAQVTAISSLASDRRVKEEIRPANLDMCIETVKALPVRRHAWQPFMGRRPDRHVTAFLADDVEKVFPKSIDIQDQWFPVYDGAKPVMHRIKKSQFERCERTVGKLTHELAEQFEIENGAPPNGNGNGNGDREEEVDVPEMFKIEKIKSLTMDQGLPTLWGATQRLIQRVEELESEVAELRKH
jgi:hypothetical protein